MSSAPVGGCKYTILTYTHILYGRNTACSYLCLVSLGWQVMLGKQVKQSTFPKQSHAFCEILILDSNRLAVHVGVVWDDEVEVGLDQDMEIGRRGSAG